MCLTFKSQLNVLEIYLQGIESVDGVYIDQNKNKDVLSSVISKFSQLVGTLKDKNSNYNDEFLSLKSFLTNGFLMNGSAVSRIHKTLGILEQEQQFGRQRQKIQNSVSLESESEQQDRRDSVEDAEKQMDMGTVTKGMDLDKMIDEVENVEDVFTEESVLCSFPDIGNKLESAVEMNLKKFIIKKQPKFESIFNLQEANPSVKRVVKESSFGEDFKYDLKITFKFKNGEPDGLAYAVQDHSWN